VAGAVCHPDSGAVLQTQMCCPARHSLNINTASISWLGPVKIRLKKWFGVLQVQPKPALCRKYANNVEIKTLNTFLPCGRTLVRIAGDQCGW
jgi:hypothetical protein